MSTAGFGRRFAPALFFLIGLVDVALAFYQLYTFNRWVYIWCVVWGFATALMRPLSGESLLAAVERAGNFLPAIAMLKIKENNDQLFYQDMQYCAMLFAAGFVFSVLNRAIGLFADAAPQGKTAKGKAN